MRKRAVEVVNLKEILGVRRIDRMENERIKYLCNMGKVVNEVVSDNV